MAKKTFPITFVLQGPSVVELPRVFVNTDIDPARDAPADDTVSSGGNLQAGFDSINPGETLEIDADLAASAAESQLRKK